MGEHIAKRRLYLGAGEFIEKGAPVELDKASTDRLLATGAIAPTATKSDEPEAETKAAPKRSSRKAD